MSDYINRVDFGTSTLITLEDDTVTPETLLNGYTAHDRSGAPILGTLNPSSSSEPVWGEITGNLSDQLDLQEALLTKADIISLSNYLPLSGGTMTGTINLASTGFQTYNDHGYYTDVYGNFIHSSSTNSTGFWHINNYENSSKFKVYYETGNVDISGSLTLGSPLSIENGGTSATTVQYAAKNLFNVNLNSTNIATSIFGCQGSWANPGYIDLPLPIKYGGTSATTAENALSNLGAAASSTVAIYQNSNTASKAISKGQYVIWKTKLYIAKSAIASGATLSSSNLTEVTNGGLNHLLTSKQDALTFDSSPTNGSNNPVKSDGIYDALALKANLAGPTFTGTPKAPTASAGTNSTQIATTAFTHAAIKNDIKLSSVQWSGISVSANSTSTTNCKSLIDGDMPSGGTFVGLAGWRTSNNNLIVYSYAYQNNNYSLGVKNLSSSALSSQYIDIFYTYV